MVSTRSIRYKFSEGERVLCYEPDPTKAKVLYDSKVLEVIENKDKRGRRSVEYLIHFQGWNSSWDRCVSEDFVLKDTEENRQLQRDLAEKSQLQLGAYLYRRERKKGGSSCTSQGTAKRSRLGFSDDGSSSSTQPDEGETGDTDYSSGDGSGSQPPQSPPPGRAQITLPSALRDRLTFDYHLVVKRGRLTRLPASPSAAQILESFVKWFARAGAWHPPRGRHDPPQKPDLLDVSCRLNLVREVADGLRVTFDFILRGHLLYKQELDQYQEICGKYLDEQDSSGSKSSQGLESAILTATESILKNPKIPDFPQTAPDLHDRIKTEATVHTKPSTITSSRVTHEDIKPEPPEPLSRPVKQEPTTSHEPVLSQPSAPKPRDVRPGARGGNVARRLRSHKSAVSQSENEEPGPSTSTFEPKAFETFSSSVGSSGSSVSECWARPPQATSTSPSTRTPLSLLLDKVSKWQIIPREGTEHLPCRIYGAIHLARLFVKLPDFLNATQMPDFKLKLILKHIDMFVQYLDEHSEWFGEIGYIAADSI